MSKDKKAVIERLRQRISPEQREFVKMNLSVARQINAILKRKRWTQKEFARRLDKKPSEVSRMLSGMHNISMLSLAKIQVVLEEEIITTPMEACEKYKSIHFVALDSYAKPNKSPDVAYSENQNIKVVYRKLSSLKAS